MKTKTFEKNLTELNVIVEKMESSQLTVEDSLQLYEQGMKLVDHCQQYLDISKTRITKVQQKNESISTSDLTDDN